MPHGPCRPYQHCKKSDWSKPVWAISAYDPTYITQTHAHSHTWTRMNTYTYTYTYIHTYTHTYTYTYTHRHEPSENETALHAKNVAVLYACLSRQSRMKVRIDWSVELPVSISFQRRIAAESEACSRANCEMTSIFFTAKQIELLFDRCRNAICDGTVIRQTHS